MDLTEAEAALGGPPSHATDGWPTFTYWPNHATATHEETYYKWVERAWRGGLRLFVNLYVDNAALCKVFPPNRHKCTEMAPVRPAGRGAQQPVSAGTTAHLRRQCEAHWPP